MTSTIKVNNIQNQCGANIINESSNTITIGASGDTVSLASGASQSGFGRSGSVNWQTSVKTGDFTAASGEGYFINTTSGAITMTLPASPSAGDIVAFKDYANTFDTNNLTINRNGSNIVGGTINPIISVEGQAITLVYGDATQGWQAVEAATNADLPRPAYIAATGGTVTTVCTNFKVHTFTGPGTFCVSAVGNSCGSNTVDYLVIAGGGAGGGRHIGGGGGAGGYRESSGAASGCYSRSPLGACVSALPVSVQGYPITVGAGGTGNNGNGATDSTSGANSVFSTITSAGGGFGKQDQTNPGNPGSGGPGGSGGGANGGGGSNSGPQAEVKGTGNTPPVSPPQGNDGGNGACAGAGGGGGATAAGGNGTGSPNTGGNGGAGATSSINGTPTARAGGGGGNGYNTCNQGSGGSGGGGNAVRGNTPPGGGNGGAGTVNTGSGGGGTDSRPGPNTGGAGGSGIVIIRYKFQG